ncbi:MAG: hypothetical protein ABI026_06640 [Gemmatimonadaceae bacterium]
MTNQPGATATFRQPQDLLMHVIPEFRSIKHSSALPGVAAIRHPLSGWLAAAATCFALLTAAACSGSSSTSPKAACTTDVVYGISLIIRNAATGTPITDSASVRITDGSYVETYTTVGPTGVIQAARERPGTYNISVRKTDFSPFTAGGVVVTSGACHVNNVQVIAALQSSLPD